MTTKLDPRVNPDDVAQTPFRPIAVRRAADEIANQIRKEIAGGRLKPGTRLPAERQLAAELGVSRNTLREAVRSLEQSGLVETKKGAHGGIFITRADGSVVIEGLMDLYRLGGITPRQLIQAHISIEPAIVREACRLATEDDVARLYRNIDAAEAATAAGEFEKRFTLNHEFHKMLARIAGNPILVVFMDGLISLLVEFILRIGTYENEEIFASRRRFMAHFARGDAEAAEQEMLRSLERFLEGYFPHD
ncbi:putative L-lactate dehydrogenase operon regulatory protein [compost metagenome]|nr:MULTISPECIES: GntR family transcriptional regulator [Cupriavidus]URF07835.1 GntR family transcriptional regulator [Cupriavidus campinensis]CAG2133749.1 HTH-type transcriptional repressor NanR [Cupriavidus campinensis]